jgi:hypothetical protein
VRTQRSAALALAATFLIGVAGIVGVAWPSSSSGTPAMSGPVRTFASRSDLKPAAVTVTKRPSDNRPRNVFLTLGGPMIVDGKGEPVWFLPLSGRGSADLSVQQYRGQPVLTWWEGQNEATFGRGEWVMADTNYREIHRIQAGNGYMADLHDLQLTPRGTAFLTAYTETTGDLRSVGGPANGPITDGVVQEVDVETGRVLFEWHAIDHVAVNESYAQYTPGSPYDFFHINSIGFDADGNLLVSARNSWTVYKIDRTTGAVLWRLGGKRSDFTVGDGARFAWQHDARRQPDGTMTLFDDEAMPQEAPQSRGLILKVDDTSRTATLVRQYTRNLLAGSQGDMQVLPNGDVIIGWGSLPNVSEFTPDGKLRFDAHFPSTVQSYRAFDLPWHGHPTEPIAVGVARKGVGWAVSVSWNGATDVARWQVLGGPTARALQPLATAARTGFETTISTSAAPAVIVVSALDAGGHELGRSAPTRT